jgi:hypothetical protein
MPTIQLHPAAYGEFTENIQQLARVVDPEYRDAEVDLMAELYRLGTSGEDVLIPLDTVISRLVRVAYRAGYLAAQQN